MAATIDPGAFDVLTFDCYGTLIDWETGLLGALRAELDAQARGADQAYGRLADWLIDEYAPHAAERDGVGGDRRRASSTVQLRRAAQVTTYSRTAGPERRIAIDDFIRETFVASLRAYPFAPHAHA